MLSQDQLQEALKRLHMLSPNEQQELMRLVEETAVEAEREVAREDFLAFCRRVWPNMVLGPHHQKIASIFERVAKGELKRVCISIAPRSTKSEMSSFLFPSWFMGKFPHKQIMQASHKADLAVGFGRKVRNLVDSEDYRGVFPGVKLRADSKAAGRWNTSSGGAYYACGVGAGLAGFGADLLIIDDPHDEQEALQAAFKPEVFDGAYEWYTSGPRQRLQPGAAIIVIATRWGKRDLIGRLLAKAKESKRADQWEVVEIPAIMPADEADYAKTCVDGTPLVVDGERSYWPEYWPTWELQATRENTSPFKWAAQYMQTPTGSSGAMVKRHWWKRWEPKGFPEITYKIQTWDTALRKNSRNDFSVCTTWGVFEHEGNNHIMMLDRFKERMEFPELKANAKRLYNHWRPDSFLIEGKAAGDPLIFELRTMGIPVSVYTPSSGEDKMTRVNSVVDLFASGMIWIPDKEWTEDVITEFNDFPNGAHDDTVDASTMALMRFRQGRFVKANLDEDDEAEPESFHFKAAYY